MAWLSRIPEVAVSVDVIILDIPDLSGARDVPKRACNGERPAGAPAWARERTKVGPFAQCENLSRAGARLLERRPAATGGTRRR